MSCYDSSCCIQFDGEVPAIVQKPATTPTPGVLDFEAKVLKAREEEAANRRAFILDVLNSNVATVLTFFLSGVVSGTLVYFVWG